jgi:ribose 5-phosphate isomerase A
MYWNSTKKKIGDFCSQQVPNNSIIGLGSGTTSEAFIKSLGERYLKENLLISCIASSMRSEQIARKFGLPLIDQEKWDGTISIMFDGADSVDTKGTAIKGAGGELVREKIVLKAGEKVVIMVDERKWRLSWKKCPLPIAIVPFGAIATLQTLSALGYEGAIRMNNSSPFITDDGHWIVDLCINKIHSSQIALDKRLKTVPGIVETGLFLHVASSIVVGYRDGNIEEHCP